MSVPSLFGYDPFGELHKEVDRIFGKFRGGLESADTVTRMPKLDVREADGDLIIEAEMPGIDQDSMSVEVEGDRLTIKGERKSDTEEDKEGFHLVERFRGSYARSMRLPFEVDPDSVKASTEKGVLTVRMPKPAETAAKPKRIEVANGGGTGVGNG